MDLNETVSPVEAAEDIVNAYFGRESCRLEVCLSNDAFFNPSSNRVHVPLLSQYPNAESYYSTLFHEMIHSTGLPLGRDLSGLHGDHRYSEEELVAEMGAAFLLARCGIDTDQTMANSSAYIDFWRRKISQDIKLIVVAAARAEKAAKFILGELDVEQRESQAA